MKLKLPYYINGRWTTVEYTYLYGFIKDLLTYSKARKFYEEVDNII